MEGWIKLYNKMLGWEWYGDTNVVRVFLHCLLKANYMEKRWCGVVIGRGQFLTSVATMAQELHLSAQQIRTAINKLKSTNEITIDPTNKYTIITICNYESYQSSDVSKQQANKRAKKESGNNQITNEQQTNNNNIINTDFTNPLDTSDIKTTPYGDKAEPSSSPKFVFKKALIERGCNDQIAADYMAVRNKHKAPSTLTAFNGLMREADKVRQATNLSLTDIIRICAERGWQGLKADWILKDYQGMQPTPATDDAASMEEQDRILREQIRQARAARGEKEGQFKDL